MSKQIKWAIMGCGSIAKSFAKDMSFVPQAKLAAVGSRNLSKAKAFADEFNVEHAFGSYEELVRCEDVDIVYVATPHPMHFENSMLSLENGKAVLCEKPFTLNASQAQNLIAKAKEKKLFLMEAMWTRFIPATLKVKELLKEGTIGELKSFAADFGENFNFDPLHRAFNPELGGGALLDLGVYPISFASMVFGGGPIKISSVCEIGSTGVDFNESISFLYKNGATASIYSGLTARTPVEAVITGTQERIKLESPFFRSQKVILELVSSQPEIIELPFEGIGYRFEIQHSCEMLADGKLESPLMPLDETLDIMRTMDTIRNQWNLKYPQET